MEIYGKTGAKHKSNISLKEKLSNYLLEAILQAMLAVCRGISLKEKLSNYLLEAVLQAMLAVCRGIKMQNKNIAGGRLWV